MLFYDNHRKNKKNLLSFSYFFVRMILVISMIDISEKDLPFFSRRTRDNTYVMHTPHAHNKHELYFLEKGMSKYFIDSEIYVLCEGDFVFVPKGHFHKTGDYRTEPSERLLIQFDDDFLGEEYIKYIKFLEQNKHVRVPADRLYRIKEIFSKIEHEQRHKSKDYVEMQRLFLRELLILINRYKSDDINTELTNSYKIIQDAAKYINENYSLELNLDMIASKYALSRSYFSRLFKEVTGFGFSEYLNITRISASEKLLLGQNLPITEVAAACGFNDSNYFAAVFKSIKGITPKKFSKSKK